MSEFGSNRPAEATTDTGRAVAIGVGLLYLVLGGAFLLHGLDVVSLRWSLVGPALIVLLGIFLLLGGLAAAGRK